VGAAFALLTFRVVGLNMGIWSTVAAGAVCALACFWDVRTRRVPNVLTLGTALVGLVAHGVTGGVAAIAASGGGWLLGLALFMPFYLLGGLGAGDVKLLAALGAWLGPTEIVWVALYGAVAGGVLAVFVSVAHGHLRRAFANVWLLLTHWAVAGVRPMPGLTLADAAGPRLPYSVPIAAGLVATLWLR